MTMRNPDTYFLLAKVWISDCHVGYKSEGWDRDSDSLPQNCHHEVEQKIWKRTFRKIRTWKFDKKSGGHSQKKTSKNIFAFAMCFWKLVSYLLYLPGLELGIKASAFLRGITAVPGAIFWSKITIPRTETWKMIISGLHWKACKSWMFYFIKAALLGMYDCLGVNPFVFLWLFG